MYPTKETLTGHVGLEKLMQTSLLGIAQKAKQFKKHRFGNLYGLLNSNSLKEAWRSINKKAAAGVDKISAKEFAENLDSNIEEIVDKLKRKKYRAKLVRRVHIPKGKDKTRPLGIPAIADKVLQSAAVKTLEAIYEQDFSSNSYGYRPRVGAKTAINALTEELQFKKYSYIVEADIKGFFDNINHDWLISMLEIRVKDKAFIGLIRKWLKAGILEPDGQVVNPLTGTPQGGIVSPILANIYLHYALDIWFEKVVKPRCEGEAFICRYADDFICAFRYKRDAERFYQALGKRLNKFGLEVAEDKTNIISFSRFRKSENNSFEFLGFEFRWQVSRQGRDVIKKRTSRSKMRKSLANVKQWCKENRDKRLANLFNTLNAKLRGYYNYYGVIGNYSSLKEYYLTIKKMLYKWLNRRSQRRSFNLHQFEEVLKRYRMELPRITERPNNQLELDFSFV